MKTALITGAASGLGRALTTRFLAEGYRVMACDINFSGLREASDAEAWDAHSIWLRKLDISKQDHWQQVWDAVIDKWEAVDVLCNVAAYLKPGQIHQTEWQEIDKHLQINVAGLIYGSKVAAQTMVDQGRGHIINLASLAGIAPIPGISLYSTSKFAVRGFSLALAQELRPFGVNVSVICPDAIETPMLALQEDYEDAAMTFSGAQPLSVTMVVDAIFQHALHAKELEIVLPRGRGWTAKLGGAFPRTAFSLGAYLSKRGRQRQLARASSRTV